MEYQATAKYIRMSPRKVRLVADGIRGMHAVAAIAALTMLPKRATKPILDVIQSAVANAKAKQAEVATLKILHIDVMEGPVLKRWHAVSRGTAHAFKKRMSHVKVIVGDAVKSGEVKSEVQGGK